MSTQTQIIHGSAALDALQRKLQGLKDRADSLVVSDQAGCIAAKNLKLDIQAYMKAVKFETGPEIEIKKGELRQLQEQEKMLLAPAEAMLETSESKRKTWENEERRKAEEEQRRINEENQRQQRIKADEERRLAEHIATENRKSRVNEIRGQLKRGEIGKREAERLLKAAGADEEAAKAGAAAQAEETAAAAPVVQVKPNIPAVQGTVSRQNWKFRITNAQLIPLAFRMPDEVAIGRMVRDTKDKKKAEAQCAGIEVWVE
jgi:hypothetical protein